MKIEKFQKKKFIKLFSKKISLWLMLFIAIEASMLTGLIEYFVIKRNFDSAILSLSKSTKSPEELVQILKQEVLPQKGYVLSVRWNKVGKQLLELGAIDKAKYDELFKDDPITGKYMWHLTNPSKDHMVINEENSRFMVNTLWALGLINKHPILDKGEMMAEGDPMVFASTGGWSLGSKPTSELYSSGKLIDLTPEQEKLVKKIADNVYRPCCNNSTAFPDCNHGMAALGYIELAIKQGISEKQIYKDVLALNSFWFPQNYVEIAAYFNEKGIEWEDVDAKLALSSEYSSAQGSQEISQKIQGFPGLNTNGGGCGA